MAFIESKLTTSLEADATRYVEKLGDALFVGTAAMAKVLYDEVKSNASPPRLGRKTGNLEGAIYRVYSPEKSTDTVKTYRISWNKSKAPHGHLIEFGTSRAPAHPFVRPAFDHVRTAIEVGKDAMARKLGEGGA